MEKNNEYTGREIAIFTDIHALLEPTVAILEDIKRRGIKEIYSLGDDIGDGPNPKEVLNLLEENGVLSITGNSEEYTILGPDPFRQYYFNEKREKSHLWTESKLTSSQKSSLKFHPHSIDLLVGNKRIALCHFANDVRCDYKHSHDVRVYLKRLTELKNPTNQFLYTNSQTQKKEIDYRIITWGVSKINLGYCSALNDPLFKGKLVSDYDAVIQGHVHFKISTESATTKFYSIRAAGMAYGNDPVDSASYIILKEKVDGYEIEEILVPYDRNKMIQSILNSDMPNNEPISKFTSIGR